MRRLTAEDYAVDAETAAKALAAFDGLDFPRRSPKR
jgi:hypothetical protein